MSNAPTALPLLIRSPTPVPHEEPLDQLSADETVAKVVGQMMIHIDFFETWRDALLRENATTARQG